MPDALKEYVIKRIWKESKVTGEPIYVVIDDTISEKTVHSSKSKNPTEKCEFHNSHLKGNTKPPEFMSSQRSE